jgi:hypothetical protein
MAMKNSNDTVGNRHATFLHIAQCLNQLRHRFPRCTFLVQIFCVRLGQCERRKRSRLVMSFPLKSM